jgi:hypothetical protein
MSIFVLATFVYASLELVQGRQGAVLLQVDAALGTALVWRQCLFLVVVLKGKWPDTDPKTSVE